jgi:hypothetical protein
MKLRFFYNRTVFGKINGTIPFLTINDQFHHFGTIVPIKHATRRARSSNSRRGIKGPPSPRFFQFYLVIFAEDFDFANLAIHNKVSSLVRVDIDKVLLPQVPQSRDYEANWKEEQFAPPCS